MYCFNPASGLVDVYLTAADALVAFGLLGAPISRGNCIHWKQCTREWCYTTGFNLILSTLLLHLQTLLPPQGWSKFDLILRETKWTYWSVCPVILRFPFVDRKRLWCGGLEQRSVCGSCEGQGTMTLMGPSVQWGDKQWTFGDLSRGHPWPQVSCANGLAKKVQSL